MLAHVRSTRLALTLLHEVRGGFRSPHMGYVGHLPQALSDPLWHWDEDELQRLQYAELSVQVQLGSKIPIAIACSFRRMSVLISE